MLLNDFKVEALTITMIPSWGRFHQYMMNSFYAHEDEASKRSFCTWGQFHQHFRQANIQRGTSFGEKFAHKI